MNITLLRLLLALLFLLLPAGVCYRLDSRLLRQSAIVVGRLAVTLGVLAVCLYYVFMWNSTWVNILWVLLSGGVATAVYCRKRWLGIPIYVAVTLTSFVAGLLLIALVDYGRLFDVWIFLPVMAMLQADALYVCRSGLTSFVYNLRLHGGLHEYLLGNGASTAEALQPFVVTAVRRALAPVLRQLLLVGVVFVPSLLGGLLISGIAPLQAVAFVAMLTAAALCSTLLALLFSIYIYVRLK